MRIKAIKLSWFRGAAEIASLEPNGRSFLAYGENGSGKSSFIDAIEFLLAGRIQHLAHEYSGRQQDRAVPNTHKPMGSRCSAHITFMDGSEFERCKGQNEPAAKGAAATSFRAWRYSQTILRQEDVAHFIRGTKGEKYSALLPLLGLQRLETTAENLRQLAREIEKTGKLAARGETIRAAAEQRRTTFGEKSLAQVNEIIAALYSIYCVDGKSDDPVVRCTEMLIALDVRISSLTQEQKKYTVLIAIADSLIQEQITSVRAHAQALAANLEPLVAERLAVLRSADTYAKRLVDADAIKCPACGTMVAADAFKSHITAEQKRLEQSLQRYDAWRAALSELADSVTSLKVQVMKEELEGWRNGFGPQLKEHILAFVAVDSEQIRSACTEELLVGLETAALPLVDAARDASKEAPREATELVEARKRAETARAGFKAEELSRSVRQAEALIFFVNDLERRVRERIRTQSKAAIEGVSIDICKFWQILHPNKPIEEVALVVPEESDKAIDIHLKFYGVKQASPRLTLSEGYRNSLGVCIFLAIAKRAGEDRAIFLDDVVISLDRGHRGMIAKLLAQEFSDRQVILLTHDRDWYTELQWQLDKKSWTWAALLPYESPKIGIQWSKSKSTFGDARARLKDRPDAAAQDARKIMDVELAVVAEKLELLFPYLRGERNDKRGCFVFLERLIADGKKRFTRKDNGSAIVHTEAINCLDEARSLLVTWGNKSSHTFDIVPSEAQALIDACERALGALNCSSCSQSVFFAESNKSWQCGCGTLNWKS